MHVFEITMPNLIFAAGGGGAAERYDRTAVETALEVLELPAEAATRFIEALEQAAGAGADSGSVGLLILYFCLAIGVSFFCSVFEAVLLSVTRPYIATLKRDRPRRGAALEGLKTRIDRPLTSILTLNTIAHTMGAMGVASQVAALTGGGIWETLASAFMTLAVLIASEIIPKNLGARYWKTWAPWVTVSLVWLSKAMTPIVKLIGLFSKGGHHADTFSRDELTVMAEMGRREGKLHEDESRVLNNLLELRKTTVSAVKTPRVVVFSLPAATTVKDFLENHAETPFSRIPVYDESPDDMTGFVLKSEVLLAAARDEMDRTLDDLKREVTMLSEVIPLPNAFQVLTENRHHVAIVHDEYGGMSGIVTMEDIVETLLGTEIMDEVDTNEDMQEFARKQWERRARLMGIDLEEEKEEKKAPEGAGDELPAAD
ncbi:MAG: HlyC/CorC family transporter [Verrucomicrobiales bacterium]|nr:HlyC/CorC family transporter [Verrucomicrobiales bacterium]